MQKKKQTHRKEIKNELITQSRMQVAFELHVYRRAYDEGPSSVGLRAREIDV